MIPIFDPTLQQRVQDESKQALDASDPEGKLPTLNDLWVHSKLDFKAQSQ